MTHFKTLSLSLLEDKLTYESLDNEDPLEGFALICVLEPKSFAREHIPRSMNVPRGEEDLLEDLFERNKEIVVYGGSETCEASVRVAEELVHRGFRRVLDFEGGLRDWREAGHELDGAGQREGP